MTRSWRTWAESFLCVLMIATLKPDTNVRGKRLMRIGDLARATGASPRSLRYYEEQHLRSWNVSSNVLPPDASTGPQRRVT
ncbi:MerR family DNA-binding transcriptional regulator [Cryobacterium sp. Y57]|uniref:MerR family DNA-binding transcriptional regulator n=1 Tax=Cryobacterium sp. Y57 TaxID=2048287 RepID=UPI00351A1715